MLQVFVAHTHRQYVSVSMKHCWGRFVGVRAAHMKSRAKRAIFLVLNFSRTAVKSGTFNSNIRSLLLLPFLLPCRKCGKSSQRNSAKVTYITKRNWAKLPNMRKRKSPKLGQEKKLSCIEWCLEMPKPPPQKKKWTAWFILKEHRKTHIHYSFAKSTETPKLPAFHPIPSLPPPSFSVSGYSIILRILKFFEDTPDFRILRASGFFSRSKPETLKSRRAQREDWEIRGRKGRQGEKPSDKNAKFLIETTVD